MVKSEKMRPKPLNLGLAVRVTSELGNHLWKIAQGKIVQLLALEDGRFNFTVQYILFTNPQAHRDIQKCFTFFSPNSTKNSVTWIHEFSNEWQTIRRRQENTFAKYFNESDWLMFTETTYGSSTYASLRNNIDRLANITENIISDRRNAELGKIRSNISSMPPEKSFNYPPTLPIVLRIDMMATLTLLDMFFADVFQLLAFDDERCCAARPYEDETVFHFRGFQHELKKRKQEFPPKFVESYQELDPNRTAYELLAHLRWGDKVVLLSRFSEEDVLQPYINSMKDRGLQVRVITGQTGVQDLCFLKSAKKELVGFHRSSYFRYAALMSQSVKSVISYNMDLPEYKTNWFDFQPKYSERLKIKKFEHKVFQPI
jgi:hypothetical protein